MAMRVICVRAPKGLRGLLKLFVREKKHYKQGSARQYEEI